MSATRHAVTGGAIAVLILVTIAVSSGAGRSLLGPPEHHADGEGPLASSNQTGTLGQILVDRIGERRWTFGYPLCLAQGDQAAIIQSVGPTRTVGEASPTSDR